MGFYLKVGYNSCLPHYLKFCICRLFCRSNVFSRMHQPLLKNEKVKPNQQFNFQLMHTTLKNVELLKHFKIRKTAPTCFGLQGNHHQGATICT